MSTQEEKSEDTKTASAKFRLLEQISREAQEGGPLTRLDLHTALALMRWMDASLGAWRPQKLLAGDLGLSLTGIRNSVDRLIKAGHLAVVTESAGRGKATEYRFILKKAEKGNVDCTIPPRKGATTVAPSAVKKEQQPLPQSSEKGATPVKERCNVGCEKGATAVAPTPWRESIEESVEMSPPNPPSLELIPFSAENSKSKVEVAFDMWNDFAKRHQLRRADFLTAKRRKAIGDRLKECGGISGWEIALEKVSESPGLLGGGDGGWQIDLHWLIKQENFVRVMEGSFASWGSPKRGKQGKFNSLQDAHRANVEWLEDEPISDLTAF